jgi:capsule polysaccharide export protein KpsE/RkpR
VESLQAAISNSSDLRSKLEEQASGAQLEIAGAAEREKQAPAAELPQIRSEQSEAHTRADAIRMQLELLDRQDAQRESLLAARIAHRDRLDAERKAQQAALSSIDSRLTQARGDAGYRGERLKIIDPGIVPERPSSPNTSLNMFAALLLGFTLPALYFAVEINFQELRVRARRGTHVLARND